MLEQHAVNMLALGGGAQAPTSEAVTQWLSMDAILHTSTVAHRPPKSILGIILSLNKVCK